MKQQWISVKDRLPEFDVKVLIYWKLKKEKKTEYYDMIEIASLTSKTIGKGFELTEWQDSDYNNKNPTHWMPLPDVPKVVDNSSKKL